MRIIDGEPDLIKDILQEIEVIATKETGVGKVYAGIHPTLGRIVLMENPRGSGVIVEVD